MHSPAPDMIWSLNEIKYKQKATDFLCRFEDALCVFAGSVSQLYSNYEIMPVNRDFSRLVVLPDPYAHHDIFQDIEDSAVTKTGLFIMPGEIAGQDGGLLLGSKDPQTGKWGATTLQKGIVSMQKKMPNGVPFLPVLKNTDLREFQSSMPMIHLHRICTERLEKLSQFQVNDISTTIQDRMEDNLMNA